MEYRRLGRGEVAEFRAWARFNYRVGTPIDVCWHPEVQHECARMNWESASEYNVWLDDRVQLPRLLAEIRAVGLTHEQYLGLEASMDLTRELIDELLARAEIEFERVKATL